MNDLHIFFPLIKKYFTGEKNTQMIDIQLSAKLRVSYVMISGSGTYVDVGLVGIG